MKAILVLLHQRLRNFFPALAQEHGRKVAGVGSWDLGIAGLSLLAAMALAFGLVAQLIVGRHVARWLWIYSALAYFVAGILVSEIWFGWATEEELQPNIDGLSFDEVQLVTLAGLIAAVTTRLVLRRRGCAGGSLWKPAS